MDIVFYDIKEKDTDFAIIKSFMSSDKVRDLFFKQIKKEGKIVKIYHSLMQKESDGHDGESDIVIILENDKERFAIFIEDKIAADPQPHQRERYDDRAALLKDTEKYNHHYVFLCAPKAYLSTAKAEGYKYTVSHEDICSVLEEGVFEKYVFNFSSSEKKQGYSPIKNDSVTEFWQKLYKHIGQYYSQLRINKLDTARGSNASWPGFKAEIAGLRIVWKTDRNYIDLEFAGMAEHREAFSSLVKKLNLEKYQPVVTGKSLSLRMVVPSDKSVSFHLPFDDQIDNVNYALDRIAIFDKVADYIFLENIKKFPLD